MMMRMGRNNMKFTKSDDLSSIFWFNIKSIWPNKHYRIRE